MNLAHEFLNYFFFFHQSIFCHNPLVINLVYNFSNPFVTRIRSIQGSDNIILQSVIQILFLKKIFLSWPWSSYYKSSNVKLINENFLSMVSYSVIVFI